ncbi:MAG: hypothetical protein WCF26_14195 [Candidatus Sulfotelmatobacter sp.]
MGECSEGIAASEGSKNNGLGSWEAHYVSVSPQENRRGTAGEVGEGEGGAEEGCLEPPSMLNDPKNGSRRLCANSKSEGYETGIPLVANSVCNDDYDDHNDTSTGDLKWLSKI